MFGTDKVNKNKCVRNFKKIFDNCLNKGTKNENNSINYFLVLLDGFSKLEYLAMN